jgi:hypothetical protein
MKREGVARLSRAELRDWLAFADAPSRRIALELRKMVLRTVPRAAEGMKFRCPCYWKAGAFFGSIGGNICVIEVKRGRVALSFILGAGLPDPAGLLRGKAKAKRSVPVESVEEARDPRLAKLVRAAARRAETETFGEG